VTTQAPPLRQSRDTFRGNNSNCQVELILITFFGELIKAEKCTATSGTTLPKPIKEISQSLNQKKQMIMQRLLPF
jgi:hypothetical protein